MSSQQTFDPLSQRPERDAGVPHFEVACIRCGGTARLGRLWCPKCSGEKPVPVSVAAPPKSISANQYSIETLLLVTTLVGVCLGLCAAFPPVGLFVSFMAVAALIRTMIAGRQYVSARVPFPFGEKFETFFVSLLIVLYALGFSVLVLVSLCFFAWMAADLLSNFRTPHTPAEQIGFFMLSAIFWISVLIAPLTAGIWFLWATRPQ